jgi:ectoine hydroxylase-related dioxygenase (phytanoyl-CoA dioxygenase family)
MAGSLSPESLARYERDGLLFPLRAFPEGEAAALVARLEDVERRFGERYPVKALLKSYPMYLLPFVAELARHPAILDPVESILGPDLMVWGCEFFIKEPMSPKFVSWHQDLTYWGLSDTAEVTAWVALSEATVANGAMRMVPESHRAGIVPHRDTFAADNILSRGQEIAGGVDESRAVDIVLRPGEMSLHHGRMFHASGPNLTAGRRIAFVVRYIAPAMRQTRGERDFAVLVRGEDRFHHFVNPPLPTVEFAPDAVAMVARMDEDQTTFLYEGAAQKGRRDALRADRAGR